MKDEYEVGEHFDFNGCEYEVVRSAQDKPVSGGCDLCDARYESMICNGTHCDFWDRRDELNIHFKKIIK
jgi:hypothetical protein